jgi:hypothetical protein
VPAAPVTEAYERLAVCVASQTLRAYRAGALARSYPVSTARLGTGQRQGSEQTPLGHHTVRLRIGEGAPRGTVFVGRRPTGEVWTPALHAAFPQRDWILTRILWLRGCEPGHNRRGPVDTLRRYIYIHGAPDTARLGTADSHGCVRMSNDDVLHLFARVAVGTPVDLHARLEP